MKKFRLEDYEGKYAMHVKTEKEYDTFLEFLHNKGKKWCDGGSYLEERWWDEYTNNTCFAFNEGMYCSLDYFKNRNYTILEFSDFDWNLCEFTKGQDVEVSSDGKFYNSIWGKFYEYKSDLKKPFLVISKNGDITNWKYCRAIQPKYEPYTEPKLEWLEDGKQIVFKATEMVTHIYGIRVSGAKYVLQFGGIPDLPLEECYEKIEWLDGTPFGKEI